MKKKSPLISIDQWRKKAKKLSKEYATYMALKKDCFKVFGDPIYFGILDHVEKNILGVLPGNIKEDSVHDRIHSSRDFVSYKTNEDGSFTKIDTNRMIKEMAVVLKKNFTEKDIALLLEDVLQDQTPPDLLELYSRITKKEDVSIKTDPGCFKMKIGGKPGHPFELMIR